MLNECWSTHTQRGYKMKGGKQVPNCVPKGMKEEIHMSDITNKFTNKVMEAIVMRNRGGSMPGSTNVTSITSINPHVLSAFLFFYYSTLRQILYQLDILEQQQLYFLYTFQTKVLFSQTSYLLRNGAGGENRTPV